MSIGVNASQCYDVLLGDFKDVLESFIRDCDKQNIPCIFALGRKALGRACAKPVPVTVAGILSCTGVEVPPAVYFRVMTCAKYHH